MNIRDEILRSVVIHYIEDETPIGSVQLRENYRLNISSATIRNYFKELVVDGMLEQLHSSSGRIPTNDALIAFWIDELNSDTTFNVKSFTKLEKSAKEHGIFASLHSDEENALKCVDSFGEQYIILNFQNGSVLIEYNKAIKRFLDEFGTLDLKELLKISLQVGVVDITSALMRLIRENYYANVNKQALIEIAYNNPIWAKSYFESYLDGDAAFLLHNGVNIDNTVPSGCIVGKQNCKIEDLNFTLTYMGESSRDFRNFLKEAR